jgi:hypothetical protein
MSEKTVTFGIPGSVATYTPPALDARELAGLRILR